MHLNVLISSAGRRVALLGCFRESLADLRLAGRVIAIDATPYSPAGQAADAFYIVPNCTDAGFLPRVLEICERENVQLIVPTIDTELPIYAAAQERFRGIGTQIAISSAETIAICQNKVRTHNWLAARGFPVPRQSTPDAVLENPRAWNLPLMLKPQNGSASVGVRRVDSFEELAAAIRGRGSFIVQEFIAGIEHTVNVFMNRRGKCLAAVPHERLEIRAGEVSKAVTRRNPQIIEVASRLAEALPGAFGPLNIQCFAAAGEIRVIEVNARFGGGYPLAHRAGAPMTRWLLEETLGLDARGPSADWEDGLVMLRYDQAIFLSGAEVIPAGDTGALRRGRA